MTAAWMTKRAGNAPAAVRTHSPGSTGPCAIASPLDLRAAATLDRAGDAAAHPECVVGGVDDGVDPLLGDVAFDDRDERAEERRETLSPHLSRDRT